MSLSSSIPADTDRISMPLFALSFSRNSFVFLESVLTPIVVECRLVNRYSGLAYGPSLSGTTCSAISTNEVFLAYGMISASGYALYFASRILSDCAPILLSSVGLTIAILGFSSAILFPLSRHPVLIIPSVKPGDLKCVVTYRKSRRHCELSFSLRA